MNVTGPIVVRDKLDEMIYMQLAYNQQTGTHWYRDHNHTVAIFMECAEIIDHFNWKWWKDKEEDKNIIRQVQIEVVDIWHFVMSHFLSKPEHISNASKAFMDEFKELSKNGKVSSPITIINGRIINKAMKLASCYGSQLSNIHTFDYVKSAKVFVELCIETGLSFELLYLMYIGKYTLNEFRINNGYKDGRYIKIWDSGWNEDEEDGLEDNDILLDFIFSDNSSLKHASKDKLRSTIYKYLGDYYTANVVNKRKD